MAESMASFPIKGSIISLEITEKYLIAATSTKISILNLQCRHRESNGDDCSHQRIIEVQPIWDVAYYKDIMATAHDDGTLRIWNIVSGYSP
jgi:hypothetical protein